MSEVITNLQAVYTALDTINVTGHQQCKTFSNCMDMLFYTIQQLNSVTDKKEQTQCGDEIE
ncbi:MAG: hypothetical protein RR806_05665 [Oscillospiraceae bacterium]